MPESRSKFLIPAIGAVVVLTGGIAAYMYFKAPFGDSAGALGSAKVVPSTALMATYINTDPQAWTKLEQFGTPQAQELVTKSIENFNQDFFKESNISYEKDIKPWVGGVMIAVLPPSAVKPAQFNTPAAEPNPPAKLQSEPNILLVVGIKDKLAAAFLDESIHVRNQLASLPPVGVLPRRHVALVDFVQPAPDGPLQRWLAAAHYSSS